MVPCWCMLSLGEAITCLWLRNSCCQSDVSLRVEQLQQQLGALQAVQKQVGTRMSIILRSIVTEVLKLVLLSTTVRLSLRLACGVLTVQKGYRLGLCERAVPPSCRTGCPKDLGPDPPDCGNLNKNNKNI